MQQSGSTGSRRPGASRRSTCLDGLFHALGQLLHTIVVGGVGGEECRRRPRSARARRWPADRSPPAQSDRGQSGRPRARGFDCRAAAAPTRRRCPAPRAAHRACDSSAPRLLGEQIHRHQPALDRKLLGQAFVGVFRQHMRDLMGDDGSELCGRAGDTRRPACMHPDLPLSAVSRVPGVGDGWAPIAVCRGPRHCDTERSLSAMKRHLPFACYRQQRPIDRPWSSRAQ